MNEIQQGLAEYGYWVASFSYEDNDLSQWRNYADDGSGVCLGFSLQAMDMDQFASGLPKFINYLRFPVKIRNPSFTDRFVSTLTQP